jgi:hypothetical protein
VSNQPTSRERLRPQAKSKKVEPGGNRTAPASHCSRVVAQGGLKHPPWRHSWSSGIRFDTQSVVHGNPQLLLASKVALRRLDGDVAEHELNLIQFAAGKMATRAQVRRRSCGASLSMPARPATARTTSQSTLGDMLFPQTRPALLIAWNTGPSVIATAAVHRPTAAFTQVGIGTVPRVQPCRRDRQ